MFLLFLPHLLAGESHTATYCVYNKDKEACSNFSAENTFSDKNFNDAMKTLSKKHDKYNGFESVTIFIADDLSKAVADLILYKDASNIKVHGLKDDRQVKVVLNVGNIATLDTIDIRNVNCIKDDTTEFFITRLVLRNVLLSGFEKATCFYGGVLDADFLSISASSFKFESVIYHCDYTKKFEPNYRVDGAVFSNSVEFVDLLNGSSIYQYGNQFIITPVSMENGFRRTNFRAISSKNITYTINHDKKGNVLTIGSWFSNRVAAFADMNIKVLDASLIVQGPNWHGYEKLSIELKNSNLIINDSDFRLSITPESEKSTINILVDFEWDEINVNNLREIDIKGKYLKINNLILSHDKEFNIKADLVDIQSITSETSATISAITGSPVMVHSISNKLSKVTIDDLIIPPIIHFEKGTNSIPHIEGKESSLNGNKSIIELSGGDEFPALTDSWIPLLTTNKVLNIDLVYNEYGFPIKGSYVSGCYGFYLADAMKQRSHIYCISDDGMSECGSSGSEKRNVYTLTGIMEGSDITQDYYQILSIEILLDTSTQFVLDSPTIFHSIVITGISSNAKVLNDSPEEIQNLEVSNVAFDLTMRKQNPSINFIKIFESNLLENISSSIDFENVNTASFDNETYSYFASPISPHHLILNCQIINFSGSWISPALPLNIPDRIITVTNVSIISGKGGFNQNLTLRIVPQDSIKFTTNSYGTLSFKLRATKKCDVYFKAVLPFDCLDDVGQTEYVLHPDFYGASITDKNRLCSYLVNFNLQEKEFISLEDKSLYCPGVSKPSISAEISMNSPLIKGIIKINKLSIERQLYVDYDTYLHVNTFANPDDDFLVYFNWTLKEMPFIQIDRFNGAKSSTFSPSMQAYIYPSVDDDFVHQNKELFNMGIPFLCLEESDYRGTIFHDGLVFELKDFNLTMYTTYHRIGQERETDSCLYIIPYIEEDHPEKITGPINSTPWMVVLIISFLILLLLVISLTFSFFKGRKSENEENELTMSIIGETETI